MKYVQAPDPADLQGRPRYQRDDCFIVLVQHPEFDWQPHPGPESCGHCGKQARGVKGSSSSVDVGPPGGGLRAHAGGDATRPPARGHQGCPGASRARLRRSAGAMRPRSSASARGT